MPDVNSLEGWPDDIETLAKMADDGIPSPPDDKPAEPESPESKESAESKEPEPEAQEAPEAQAAEETQPAEDEELPVLTADGKKTIPYPVLRTAREAARAERERREALEAENKELKSKLSGVAPPPPVEDPPDQLPAEVAAHAEKLRKDWGDDHADLYLKNYTIEQQLKQVQQQLASTRRVQEDSEQAQIRRAIDNSPAMAAWEADTQSPWFDRAGELHSFLLKSDPDYARAGWDERFALLPEKVAALYGAPLPAAAPKTKSKPAAPALTAAQAAALPPASISDIRGGAAPAAEKSPIEKIEEMDPAKMTDLMIKLAGEPGKLDEYLASLL